VIHLDKFDKVTLKDISIYAYHGVLPEEKERGQEFRVNVELYTNFEGISQTDQLEQVIDYRQVLESIQKTATGTRFDLLEALAEHLALNLLQFDRVKRVKISVAKPRPPLPAVTGGVEVSVVRSCPD